MKKDIKFAIIFTVLLIGLIIFSVSMIILTNGQLKLIIFLILYIIWDIIWGVMTIIQSVDKTKNKKKVTESKLKKIEEECPDLVTSDEILRINNLIHEKKQEIQKIRQEARLQEVRTRENLEQEVREEYEPIISEIESCLAKSVDKEEIKDYNSQIKKIHKQMIITLKIEQKNLANEIRIKIRQINEEINQLNERLSLMELRLISGR